MESYVHTCIYYLKKQNDENISKETILVCAEQCAMMTIKFLINFVIFNESVMKQELCVRSLNPNRINKVTKAKSFR